MRGAATRVVKLFAAGVDLADACLLAVERLEHALVEHRELPELRVAPIQQRVAIREHLGHVHVPAGSDAARTRAPADLVRRGVAATRRDALERRSRYMTPEFKPQMAKTSVPAKKTSGASAGSGWRQHFGLGQFLAQPRQHVRSPCAGQSLGKMTSASV